MSQKLDTPAEAIYGKKKLNINKIKKKQGPEDRFESDRYRWHSPWNANAKQKVKD